MRTFRASRVGAWLTATCLLVALGLAALVSGPCEAATIFSDDFETAFSGYTETGSPDWFNSEPSNGAHSIRFRAAEGMQRTISTTDYTDITVSFYICATNYSSAAQYTEVHWYDGSTWTLLKRITNGDPEEDGVLHYLSYALPAGAESNASFALRFLQTATMLNHRTYVDDIVVTGTPVNSTLNLSGANGQVRVNGTLRALPYSETFATDTVVDLEAVPDTGYGFTGWSGDLGGSANPTTLTMSDHKSVTANFTAHTFSVTAAAAPTTVASSGTTSLTGSSTDSLGHGVASWSWEDGGAGGAFSPSADVQNPTYTAPANTGDSDISVTLTLTATCDGSEPITDSDSVALTVNPVAHTLSVTASASPDTVASSGSSDLFATAADSRSGHSISYAWDDGGAGGAFAPSADVQDPTYTAPANLTDSDTTVTLTVTATCDGPSPLSTSDSATLTVNPVAHTFSVTQTVPDPSTVASGGMSALSASAADSRPGHSVASWSWDDDGAGGSFSPSADFQNPTYLAPENLTDDDALVTLTVTATCDGPSPLSDDAARVLTVEPALHTLVITATAAPTAVLSGGSTSLTATAADSRSGHSFTWSWDDGGAGGTFTPSADVQNPTYTALANLTDSDLAVTLTVTVTCDGPAPLTESASAGLTVSPIAHSLSVAASASPGAVASGGSSDLTAAATDSRPGHTVSYAWADGGAGGSFAPSANVQNPTYTAPANTGDSDVSVTLTVTATCDGPSPLSDVDSTVLTVNPVSHTLSVAASASPGTVASGGSSDLSAAATDSRPGHTVSYAWADGGAGGSFAPSANVQNPTYTAPANTGDSDVSVTLTVTATCDGPSPLSDVDSTLLTVNPVSHTLSVTAASPTPATVASGGSSLLSASSADSRSGHSVASWSWDDGGAGGSFAPSANVQNPTYTAPTNTGDSDISITLTVTATCDGPSPLTDSDTTTLTVNPVAHTLSVTAAASPSTVNSGGATSLTASAVDSRSGHSIATWSWSDGGAGGSFSPSADVQNPTYTAAANSTDDPVMVTLTVTAACDGPSPISDSDSATLTVNPANHTLSVTATADPATVASGGTTSLIATAVDSRTGHSIASWSWSDGGAGGSFAPSAAVQNPTYTAAENPTDTDRTVTLTVLATCDGASPISNTDSTNLTVQAGLHSLSVTASVTPSTIPNGGTASLSATATDTQGHAVSYAWSDGGLGGTFWPSASVQGPSYTPTANITGSDRIITLTVTVTCDGDSPLSASDSTTLTQQTVIHVFGVTASCTPTTVDSGGVASLSATYSDSQGHGCTWFWSDSGAGGAFSPSATVSNPTYTAPENISGSDLTVLLTVTGTCNGPEPLSDSDSVTLLVVSSAAGTCELISSNYPAKLEWGGEGSVSLAFRNLDSFPWSAEDGYQVRAWAGMNRWGLTSVPLGATVLAGDTYPFSFLVEAPPLTTLVYPTPVTETTPGTLDGLDCSWQMSRGAASLTGGLATQEIAISRFRDAQPGTAGAWARFWIEECAGRVPLIVGGYDDGTYRPTMVVDRAAMAVYMARALKLDLGAYLGSFSDIPETFWAAQYIEALVAAGIVVGYDNGTYRPSNVVDRAAMTVYVSRGLVGGDENVPAGPATPSFTDTPATHWAYKYVEFAKIRNVVTGYSDGTYRPTQSVTRDQMSVYVYRGFIQPTGTAVVLGGPGVTEVDPATAPGFGWASLTYAPSADPGYAYVTLDAVRLNTNLVYPQTPTGTCEVVFELRLASDPNTPATGNYTAAVSLTAADLAAAHSEAVASGFPYYAASWGIPAGLAPGDYLLVLSIEDESGVMRQVGRKPAFTITP